jgi:hypothetical protein
VRHSYIFPQPPIFFFVLIELLQTILRFSFLGMAATSVIFKVLLMRRIKGVTTDIITKTLQKVDSSWRRNSVRFEREAGVYLKLLASDNGSGGLVNTPRPMPEDLKSFMHEMEASLILNPHYESYLRKLDRESKLHSRPASTHSMTIKGTATVDPKSSSRSKPGFFQKLVAQTTNTDIESQHATREILHSEIRQSKPNVPLTKDEISDGSEDDQEQRSDHDAGDQDPTDSDLDLAQFVASLAPPAAEASQPNRRSIDRQSQRKAMFRLLRRRQAIRKARCVALLELEIHRRSTAEFLVSDATGRLVNAAVCVFAYFAIEMFLLGRMNSIHLLSDYGWRSLSLCLWECLSAYLFGHFGRKFLGITVIEYMFALPPSIRLARSLGCIAAVISILCAVTAAYDFGSQAPC